MEEVELIQIGVIHSSYKERLEAPRQGRFSDETQVIEVYPEYMEGIKGIENVSHLIILYWFDRANRKNPLFIKPREGNEKKEYLLPVLLIARTRLHFLLLKLLK